MQLNLLHRSLILKNSFKQTWYDTSSSQLKCLCFSHSRRTRRCVRSCIDYQELNIIILKNKCFFSLINEFLNYLENIMFFIKLNIKNAFNKLCIKKENEWKMWFCTRFDLYEYLVMLFNLINTLTFFQIYMNQTLFKFLDIICLIYLNDILIFSKIHNNNNNNNNNKFIHFCDID